MADSTYSVTTTVVPDEGEDFDEYPTTTTVVVSDGKITSITTEGSGSNYTANKTNAKRNQKAASGILTQLQDSDATIANIIKVDTVTR